MYIPLSNLPSPFNTLYLSCNFTFLEYIPCHPMPATLLRWIEFAYLAGQTSHGFGRLLGKIRLAQKRRNSHAKMPQPPSNLLPCLSIPSCFLPPPAGSPCPLNLPRLRNASLVSSVRCNLRILLARTMDSETVTSESRSEESRVGKECVP